MSNEYAAELIDVSGAVILDPPIVLVSCCVKISVVSFVWVFLFECLFWCVAHGQGIVGRLSTQDLRPEPVALRLSNNQLRILYIFLCF
jgi:hypothetical protein